MHLHRGKSSAAAPTRPSASSRYGFEYLAADTVYLDSACQTLRPQPVIDALNDYYLHYNACGERVKYEWGRKVDDHVAATRQAILDAFKFSSKHYVASFTLNTTYGLNLLLAQLPRGRYKQKVAGTPVASARPAIFSIAFSDAKRTWATRRSRRWPSRGCASAAPPTRHAPGRSRCRWRSAPCAPPPGSG